MHLGLRRNRNLEAFKRSSETGSQSFHHRFLTRPTAIESFKTCASFKRTKGLLFSRSECTFNFGRIMQLLYALEVDSNFGGCHRYGRD